jgi:hypothetical protein
LAVDAQIALEHVARTKTVENFRECHVTDGFVITLNAKSQARRPKLLSGEQKRR